MALAFANKDSVKFYDLTIKVSYEGACTEFYFYRLMVSQYPKILSEIKGRIWKINGKIPEIIRMFIIDLHCVFKNEKFIRIESRDHIYALYDLARLYDIEILQQWNELRLGPYKLNPEFIRELQTKGHEKLIPKLYLKMPPKDITREITQAIHGEMWDQICEELSSLESFYNYFLRFTKDKTSAAQAINRLYNKKLYINDLRWLLVFPEDIPISKEMKEVMMNFLLRKLIDLKVLPERYTFPMQPGNDDIEPPAKKPKA